MPYTSLSLKTYKNTVQKYQKSTKKVSKNAKYLFSAKMPYIGF